MGKLPKFVLALLIAIAVFAALRLRGLAPEAPEQKATSAPTGAAAANSPMKIAAVAPHVFSKPAEEDPVAVTRGPASVRAPLELFTELFRKGEWSITMGRDGRPTGLRGKPIPGATADGKSALAFARKVATQLGVSPDQLSDAHQYARTNEGLQTLYKYDQWIGEYPVFGGSLSVISLRSDDAPYLVNSTLKPVDQAPSGGIDRASAEALVLHYYSDRGGTIGVPIVSDAFVYADQAPTELAWYFLVNVTTPSQSKLKVLFGATTRRVLYEAPALVQ